MDDVSNQNGSQLVAVEVQRLLPIIRAIYADGLDEAVIQRYGTEVFLLTKEQADRWHSFVDTDVVQDVPAGSDIKTNELTARRPKLVGPHVKAVMAGGNGANTAHCKPGRV